MRLQTGRNVSALQQDAACMQIERYSDLDEDAHMITGSLTNVVLRGAS